MTADLSAPLDAGPRGWARFRAPPLWLGLGWGFTEATLFFVVPDLIITWAALSSIRQGLKQLTAVVWGSIAGGLLIYFVAAQAPARVINLVGAVPFVRSTMFDTVQADFTHHGVWALCRGPLSGIPYKVYASLAPGYVDPVSFALASIPARVERLIISFAIFSILGVILRRWWPRWDRLPFALFFVYWGVIYGYYWTRI